MIISKNYAVGNISHGSMYLIRLPFVNILNKPENEHRNGQEVVTIMGKEGRLLGLWDLYLLTLI